MRAVLLALLLVGCMEGARYVPPPVNRIHPASPIEATDVDPDPKTVHVHLRAAAKVHDTEQGPLQGYAYNDGLPGPTIRARLGDRLVVDLENAMDVSTTIHWHGLKVPYAMDGVTWQSAPVLAGGAFTYSFTLTQAGTFWYHPHFDSAHQVDGGLYGALIVEDPADPLPDEELVLIFDQWNEAPMSSGGKHDDGHDHTAGHTHDHGLGTLTAHWIVNGQTEPFVHVEAGHSVRVRMINASNAGYLDLRWPGIRHIASDQGLLAALSEPTGLVLAPGDRADVEWLVGGAGFAVTTAPWSLNGGAATGPEQTLLTVEAVGTAAAPSPLAWPFSGLRPTPDPPWSDITYVLTGSAIGGQWLINGEAFPNVTLHEIAAGATAVIEVRNLSSTEHPFHLHGVPFEVLSVDGVAPKWLTIEDTLNIAIRQTVRLRVVGDNPGDWMAHCHILTHADQGMMTVLRIH